VFTGVFINECASSVQTHAEVNGHDDDSLLLQAEPLQHFCHGDETMIHLGTINILAERSDGRLQ
jgi:hypothetical protein